MSKSAGNIKPQKEMKKKTTNLTWTKCLKCDELFLCKLQITKHLLYHNRKLNLKCKSCDASYNLVSSLKRHTKLGHISSNYDRYSLLATNSDGRYICTQCNSTFNDSTSARRHMGIHSQEKQDLVWTKCPKCDESFLRMFQLSKHLSCHDREYPFKCKLCDASFNSSSSLKRHAKRGHQLTVSSIAKNSDGNYSCTQCNKTFKRSRSAKRHIGYHSQAFKCKKETCNLTFKHATNLARHMGKDHKEYFISKKYFHGKKKKQHLVSTWEVEQDVWTSDFLKAYERAKCSDLKEELAEEGQLLSKPRTLFDEDNPNKTAGKNFPSEEKPDDEKISQLVARKEAIKRIVNDWDEVW